MPACPVVLALTLAIASPVFARAAQDQQLPVLPPCSTSPRETYGHTVDDPILVGGGAMTVASRERAVLDSLRGPDGQPIKYRRLGQMRGSAQTILDGYEVTYDGLAKPITLYLDAYRWSTPMAPRGFICARAIPLSTPPPDPFETQNQFVRIAVDYGRSRDLLPMPIDSDGTMAHGFALDHFRLVARASRAASLSGKPLDPENLPPDLMQARTLVVAFPEACDGKIRTPRDLEITNARKLPARRLPDVLQADRLRQMVPGATIPDGAIGALFQISSPREQDTIRIAYDMPCGSDPADLLLAVLYVAARPLQMNVAALPPGAQLPPPPAQPVSRVQVLVAPNGVPWYPVYMAGPDELVEATAKVVLQWRWEPARVNGAPLLTTVSTVVSFVK